MRMHNGATDISALKISTKSVVPYNPEIPSRDNFLDLQRFIQGNVYAVFFEKRRHESDTDLRKKRLKKRDIY